MKPCTKCGETKPLDEYYKNKKSRGGRLTQCKACVKVKKAEYQARPEVNDRLRAYKSKWRAENAEHIAEYRATHAHLMWECDYRKRAKKYGFAPVIERFTKPDVIAKYGDSCWHCGGPFESVDHFPVPLVRGAHHTLESVVPACMDCNRRSWTIGASDAR